VAWAAQMMLQGNVMQGQGATQGHPGWMAMPTVQPVGRGARGGVQAAEREASATEDVVVQKVRAPRCATPREQPHPTFDTDCCGDVSARQSVRARASHSAFCGTVVEAFSNPRGLWRLETHATR
jgi:hypothetical protein